MPLPFPEFAEATKLAPLALDILPYSALPSAATGEVILGEIVAESAAVAGAAVLAEPLIVLGAGLAAGAAAEAILHHLQPNATAPQIKQRLPTGGRIGGNAFAQVRLKLKTDVERVVTPRVQTPLTGDITYTDNGPVRNWFIPTIAGLVGVLSAAPSAVEITPVLIGLVQDPGDSGTPVPMPANFVNPGTGILPTPVSVLINLPGGNQTRITPTVYPSPKTQPDAAPFSPQSPGVLVFVPEVGIAINFGPSNVAIMYTQPQGDTNYPVQPPNITTNYSYPKLTKDCPPLDTRELLCRIKRLETDLLDGGYDYTPRPRPAVTSDTVDNLPDELDRVELTLTNNLAGKYFQYGNGNAPDAAFIGWFSFRIAGISCPRIPIPYAVSSFPAPRGATGYNFTATHGATISATAITRKRKPYVDNC